MCEKTTLIQLDFSDEKIAILDDMMHRGGADRRELFNSALTLLKQAIKERKNGKAIGTVDKISNTYSTPSIPFLGQH